MSYDYRDVRLAGVRVEQRARGAALHVDRDLITLLHGTTAMNAELIRQHGFKALDATAVVAQIAELYDLEPHELYQHSYLEFVRARTDKDRVFFTALESIARQYTVPEVVQDALSAVWQCQHGWGDKASRKVDPQAGIPPGKVDPP